MRNKMILPVLALLTCGAHAMAQESGGLRIAPSAGTGPVGLARPLPVVPIPMMTAQQAQNGMTASDHQAQNQALITSLRGDAGFLSGFSMGTPLAASRQTTQANNQAWGNDGGYWQRHGHRHEQAPIVIDNNGPLAVTVGNNNVVQQQSATGSGPIALQQVATSGAGSHTGGGGGTQGGGAVNIASGSGNILQRAPGGN